VKAVQGGGETKREEGGNLSLIHFFVGPVEKRQCRKGGGALIEPTKEEKKEAQVVAARQGGGDIEVKKSLPSLLHF